MSLINWLIYCSLGLVSISAGQPAVKHYIRQDIPRGLDIIVYDANVASATRVREVVQWLNGAGEPVGTATEDVLLLPTSLALGAVSNSTEVSSRTTPPPCTKTLIIPSFNSPPSGCQDGKILGHPVTPQAIITSKPAGPQATEGTGSPFYGAPDDGKKASDRFGVSYTPYRADQGCKTQRDVDSDFDRMAGAYNVIRTYGTDCHQVPMLYSAAKGRDMKLFLGIWNLQAVEDEVRKIISGLQGDWDMVHTISVGNELVNNGEASPAEVLDCVGRARSMLRAAGYNGPVVTVDTFTAVLAHPELCDESDYCAVNAHAFFDGNVLPSQSGMWLQDTVSKIRSVISDKGKEILVAETGWPTRGDKNGVAVPGLDNQKLALQSIKEAFAGSPESIVLFSAFNDLWKKLSSATFNADPFWGIDGATSSCDE